MVERKKRPSKKTAVVPQKKFFEWNSTVAIYLGAALFLALLVRLFYVIQLQDSIFYGNYVLDSTVIDNWAKDIASGDLVGENPYFRAPLYPYIVGLFYSIFGEGPFPVIIYQNLLGLLTVTLTFFYARYLFSERIARIAGFAVAFWPTLFYFEGELMITTTSVFLSTAAIISLHLALERGRRRGFLLAGLILGLAAIARPTILPIVLVVPVYYWFKRSRTSVRPRAVLRYALLYIAGIAIPIVPVTVRNAVVADDMVLISSQAGANFYIGNSKRADGLTVAMPAYGPIYEAGEYNDNIYTQSKSVARYKLRRDDLKDSEVSSFWVKETLGEIGSNPARFVILIAKKFYYFWHGQEIFNNKSLYYAAEYSVLMKILLWKNLLNFPSGIMFPLMLAGIVIAIRQRREVGVPLANLILYSLVVTLFFVCSRFRQPIIPVALIFAAFAADYIVAHFKSRNTDWKLGVGVFAAFVVLLNLGGDIESRINKSQYQNMLGNLYLHKDMFKEAVPHFQKALEIAPDNRPAIGALATAYSELGMYDQAEVMYKRGIQLHRNSAQFHYNLGTLYYNTGRYDEAKPYYWRVIQLDPRYVNPYKGLGAIYEMQDKPDSAIVVFKTLLRHDPRNPFAHQKLRELGAE